MCIHRSLEYPVQGYSTEVSQVLLFDKRRGRVLRVIREQQENAEQQELEPKID